LLCQADTAAVMIPSAFNQLKTEYVVYHTPLSAKAKKTLSSAGKHDGG